LEHAEVRLDYAGVVLIVIWLVWIVVASIRMASNPLPAVLLVSGCALAMWVSRAAATRTPVAVPTVVVILAAVFGGSAGAALVDGGPLAKPLGYANANAAFFVQAAVAGLMVGRIAKRRWLRGIGFAAAFSFALVPALTGSTTGVLLLIVVTPVALLLERGFGARTAVAFCAGFWVVVLAGSVWLGALYEPGVAREERRGLAVTTLSERRLILWSEALMIATEHPTFGIGASGFAEASATARADRDARFAHHEFLQHAAEVGIPGVVLMIAAFACGFLLLGIRARTHSYVVLPAVGWTALGAHASIDYVLHFAAVPLAAASLLGAGLGVGALGQVQHNWRRTMGRGV
jgi:O-antigen ligase